MLFFPSRCRVAQIFSRFNIFLNQFNFDFLLFQIMIMDIGQRKIKIDLVWKILNQEKFWTKHNIQESFMIIK